MSEVSASTSELPGDGQDLEARFWQYAEPLLAANQITRSTMMGYPCLRVDGKFFASFDRQTGCFVAKLPAERVAELIDAGSARVFAPAGRPFREWAAFPPTLASSWPDLLTEALEFVASSRPAPRASRARRPRRS